MEQKLISLGYAEVIMFGDYVGVCWSTRQEQRIITLDSGAQHKVMVPIRDGSKPYINFISIEKDNDGEYYADVDSPVAGGLNVNEAEKVAKELLAAVEYMRGHNL